MENKDIRLKQLEKRDIEREISQIKLAINKREKELEQLKINLGESEENLRILNLLLEGQVYKGNT